MESSPKRNLLVLLLFIQLIIPAVVIIIFQQLYLLSAGIILGHLIVIYGLNLLIILIGLILISGKLFKYRKVSKFLIAGSFGILNVLLYFTYLFAFMGEHFNSKTFTLQIVLGYLKYFDQLITNFSINPIWVYLVLIVIPILIFTGTVLLANHFYRGILSFKKFIKKHNFNNPPKLIKYNIIGFFVLIGLLLGVVLATPSKIPYQLFKIEEPFVTVFFKNNDPFNAKMLSDTNEDIGTRNAYPKNLDFQRKNVIVIVIDALRSDHLSLFGYERKTTPFLDSLYADGNLKKIDLSFSVSAESFAGINAILRSKIWHNLGYNNFSLQQLLKDQGYDINFIISGDHTNFSGLKSFYGKDSDFDYYLDGSITENYSDPNDDRIILEGLSNIENYRNTPAYFHFHLMSAHNLGVRLNNFKKYKPAGVTTFDTENYINRYDNGILQADNFLKQIFSSLSKKGYLQNSVVVITGDHGEALGERGEFGHNRNIYNNQILTPILIYDSDNVNYKNTTYATLVDIAPTIIDRLGLPIPDSWEGISLYNEENNRQITYHQQNEHYAIVHTLGDKRFKFLYNSRSGKQELYELNSDLYETRNIIDSMDAEYVNTLRWYMNGFDIKFIDLYNYPSK